MFLRTLASLGRMSFYIASFLVGFILVSAMVFSVFSPASDDPNAPVIKFQVNPNDDFKTIAKNLQQQGLIKNWRALYYLVRLKGSEFEQKVKKISVGEYQIASNMKLNQIINILISGDVIYYKFTIPEGASIGEITKIVTNSGLVSSDQFALALNNQSLILKLGIPYRSLEGFLFPETYKFTKPITAEKIIENLVQEGKSRYTPELKDRTSQMGLTVDKVIVLASIIEKETGKAEERPLISSVFHNRLRLDMPLQSDPTVIYGIPNFNGNLTRDQLKAPSSYNTYLNRGLPPTAICNPGIESIKAALYPVESDYLYFVAKGDGSHYFSATYKEHREAVNRYQRDRVSEPEIENFNNREQLQAILNQQAAPKPTPAPVPTPKPKKYRIDFLDPKLKDNSKDTQSDRQRELFQKILEPNN